MTLSVMCSNQILPRGFLAPTKILDNDMTHNGLVVAELVFFFFFLAFNRYFPLTLDWNYVLCFMLR